MRSTIAKVFLVGCVGGVFLACGRSSRNMRFLTGMQAEGKQAEGKKTVGENSDAAFVPYRELVKNYCVDCHSGPEPKGTGVAGTSSHHWKRSMRSRK